MDVAQLLEGHGSTVAAVAGAVVSIAVSVLVTCVVIVRLPADHFACDHRPSTSRAVRWGRNVGGVLLIALGVVLSFPGIPGQGVLTILLGIMCLDVAGKRKLELWVVRKPRVHHAIDALRARYGKAPLELPDDEGSSSGAPPSPRGALAVGAGAGARGASRRDSTT